MASVFQNAIVLLDRYYLTVPALDRLDALNAGGGNLRAIIMAKINSVAYEQPGPRKMCAKGRPLVKGKTVKLVELFTTEAHKFVQRVVHIYGKEQTIRYLAKDLLWGRGKYRKMRFVLVDFGGRQVIIVSTDTSIPPESIIALYSKRFTIECTFKAMKHDTAALSNRFWTQFMPKLNRYSKISEKDRLAKVKTEHGKELIRKALDATEGYVFCGVVATGLLQLISLLHMKNKDECKKIRYLRTQSKTAESEATVAEYLRRNIFLLLQNDDNLPICKIILEKID
jgi:hypothetical protein